MIQCALLGDVATGCPDHEAKFDWRVFVNRDQNGRRKGNLHGEPRHHGESAALLPVNGKANKRMSA